MLKKLVWEENAVFSLQLRDNLFSLCQMRTGSIMQFFGCCSIDDTWPGVDLDQEKILGQYFVAENKLKPLFARKIDPSEVRPNSREVPRLMLSAIIEANDQYGGSLVRLNTAYSMLGEEMVTANLDKDVDWEIIRSHEFMGMEGSVNKLRARLLRYFDTGVWWDDQKSFLFRGIRLPEPDKDFVPCQARTR